jgi:hypothetical protein
MSRPSGARVTLTRFVGAGAVVHSSVLFQWIEWDQGGCAGCVMP